MAWLQFQKKLKRIKDKRQTNKKDGWTVQKQIDRENRRKDREGARSKEENWRSSATEKKKKRKEKRSTSFASCGLKMVAINLFLTEQIYVTDETETS